MISIIILGFGLVVGSFLNVLIDRLPKGQNPFKGRSHCDHCRHVLSALDLIPVVSFLWLKGKCRYCRKKLSFQYPIIETLTSLLFISLFWYQVNVCDIASTYCQLNFLSLLIIFSSFLVICMADLKYQIIPDLLIVAIVLGALLYTISSPNLSLLDVVQKLASGLLTSLFFLSIFGVTRGRGMGFGDVKLSFALGFWLGIPNIITGLYLAFLTGALVSIILILARKRHLKSKVAFGPFLIFGSGISFFFGNKLAQWYLSLLN